ncbi:MAG TPA: GNAT family N-acetyltransferase [Anaerolineales bacterium]|nr:GNAT family N-acetyltransferase [Anaerolineales bacterium]
MTITVRKLHPDESALYRAIRLQCLKTEPDHFGSTFEEESSMPRLKFESWIEQNGPDHFMFGAFDGEKLAGIVGFMRQERHRARHRGEVVQMYVDASYRGQRLGESLLRGLLNQAFTLDGVEQAQLSVVAHNRAAIRLYERIGFRAFGVQPNYFKVGVHYFDQQFMQLMKGDFLTENR